jgi:hypothetical protein
MNGPIPAICRKTPSRRFTNLFLMGFGAFMVNMYIYVLLKATKKSPATTFCAAGAPAALAFSLWPAFQPLPQAQRRDNSGFLNS